MARARFAGRAWPRGLRPFESTEPLARSGLWHGGRNGPSGHRGTPTTRVVGSRAPLPVARSRRTCTAGTPGCDPVADPRSFIAEVPLPVARTCRAGGRSRQPCPCGRLRRRCPGSAQPVFAAGVPGPRGRVRGVRAAGSARPEPRRACWTADPARTGPERGLRPRNVSPGYVTASDGSSVGSQATLRPRSAVHQAHR